MEDVLLPNPINTWPVCIAGQNAGPPEDVGGVGGYAEFLEAIQDPEHDEHDVMWNWCGGPFDPTGFDVNGANAAFERFGSDSMSRQHGRSHPVRRTVAPVRARTRVRSGRTVFGVAITGFDQVLRLDRPDTSIGPTRRSHDMVFARIDGRGRGRGRAFTLPLPPAARPGIAGARTP